jgi:P2-related tail formation protein
MPPVVGETTERLYDGLPEMYRDADVAVSGDQPLLRWLSLVGDQASELETIVDRLSTDLTDPLEADDLWLDWLAQAVGVQLQPAMSEAERRNAVAFSSSGWRAGTKQAIKDAAKPALTGTQFVEVYDHSTDVSVRGAAGEFDVLLVTRGTETPDVAEVLATIVRQHAKPAGVKLYHRAYDTSWNTVTATYPTWNAIEAAGSWDRIQEAGL